MKNSVIALSYDWEMVRLCDTDRRGLRDRERASVGISKRWRFCTPLDISRWKSGPLPLFLVQADYFSIPACEANLFVRAHDLAAVSQDLPNLLLTAASLAEFYIEAQASSILGELWLCQNWLSSWVRNGRPIAQGCVRLQTQLKALREAEGPHELRV